MRIYKRLEGRLGRVCDIPGPGFGAWQRRLLDSDIIEGNWMSLRCSLHYSRALVHEHTKEDVMRWEITSDLTIFLKSRLVDCISVEFVLRQAQHGQRSTGVVQRSGNGSV